MGAGSTREAMHGEAGWARRVAAAIPLLLVVILALSACGSSPGADAGGTLMVACQPPAHLDPHFAALASEEMINHQIYDWLVILDGQNRPTPNLATDWEMSEDGKTWTFTIRGGVKFSNGSPLTVDDIVYSFDRMSDPGVGAPTSSLFDDVGKVAANEASHGIFSLFSGILSVSSTDSSHVVFSLRAPNPEFAKDLADYHAAIISKSVKDPSKELVGTGPFMVEKYLPGDRMILVKNPYYWRKAADGAQLPYLDGVTFVFSPDEKSQAQALQNGDVDFVGSLSAKVAWQAQTAPDVKLLTTRSNFHLLVHVRSDEGHPGADPRVRLALRLGTDHAALVSSVCPGFGTIGNGTIVGPTYGDYYWDHTPKYDPRRARKLLAAAGHGDGFTMKLYVVEHGDAGAYAAAWREQMAKIGVTVKIVPVPEGVYYAEHGGATWMTCDFGVTNWADRATPAAYFNLAYVTGGLYNESHWSDAEFDALASEIDRELDAGKRAELYRRAQQILWERGPVVVLGHENAVAGVSTKVDGITLPIDWGKVLFNEAHFVH